jgi:hypothetical protein
MIKLRLLDPAQQMVPNSIAESVSSPSEAIRRQNETISNLL